MNKENLKNQFLLNLKVLIRCLRGKIRFFCSNLKMRKVVEWLKLKFITNSMVPLTSKRSFEKIQLPYGGKLWDCSLRIFKFLLFSTCKVKKTLAQSWSLLILNGKKLYGFSIKMVENVAYSVFYISKELQLFFQSDLNWNKYEILRFPSLQRTGKFIKWF